MILPDPLHAKVTERCKLGDSFFEQGMQEKALKEYEKALELIPVPKTQWETSSWVFAAIGDVFFYQKKFKRASDYFYDALNCPGTLDNPFLNLRLGQCLYEIGEIEKAEDFLLRAYMIEGKEIFKSEDEKYFKILENKNYT
jgi:tetratricopeptide (TPR) repeat protein